MKGKWSKVMRNGVLDGAAHELETLQCVREHIGNCGLEGRGGGLPSTAFVKIEVESSRRKGVLPDFPNTREVHQWASEEDIVNVCKDGKCRQWELTGGA